MFPANYAIAVALLTAPADKLPTADVPGTRPALRQVALAWEILDPRETGYYLASAADFAVDVRCLRTRYADLMDAPPLCDCLRFPLRARLCEARAFNREYYRYLVDRRALDPGGRWNLHEAIAETDRLYQIYDTAADTRCDYFYITVRRMALKRLREMLGDEAYFAGCLPAPVPVWRLARTD